VTGPFGEERGVTTTKFRVAVLYSGRWFGSAARHWILNHRSMLYSPNTQEVDFSVFVVASLPHWCSRNTSKHDSLPTQERRFQEEVRDAFGEFAVEVHAALVPEPRWNSFLAFRLAQAAALRSKYPAGLPAGGLKQGQGWGRTQAGRELANIARQFDGVARAEHLRRMHGPHHAIVRARLDVQLSRPLTLAPMVAALRRRWDMIFLPWLGPWRGRDKRSEALVEWSDRMWVTSADGMAPLIDAVSPSAWGPSATGIVYYNSSRRCEGYCPEEQLVLVLEHAGITLRPMPLNASLRRIYQFAPGERENKLLYRQRMKLIRSAHSQECHSTGDPYEPLMGSQVSPGRSFDADP